MKNSVLRSVSFALVPARHRSAGARRIRTRDGVYTPLQRLAA
jgi:hypothetical protein